MRLAFNGGDTVKIERKSKASFSVIGKEGSSESGAGFVQALWEQANAGFGEVAPLAKRDENGNLEGIWGAMSDVSRSYLPWEEGFTKGLYLAGVECPADAQPPQGWVKWTIPSYTYLVVKCEKENPFAKMILYLSENSIPLVGAVHDFTDPSTGENFMYFPIEKL